MKYHKRIRAALAGMTIIAGLWVEPTLAEKADNSLRVGQRFPIATIDPYYTVQREVYALIGEMAFDTLVFEDPRTGKFVPLLAKEWKWIDEVTLELKLRDDVKWHDGEQFTADDVIYTLDYILDPEKKTARYDQYSMIEGAEKIGEFDVRIKLKAPFGAIMPVIANLVPILPKGFFAENASVQRLVGTGPYKFVSFSPGAGAVLELSGSYFPDSPKGMPTIQTFEYIYLPEMSTQIAELITGNIDWVWRLSKEDQERLSGSPGITAISAGSLRNNFLVFDAHGVSGETPIKDLRVRQAIAHAIDRERIVKELVPGGEGALHQPCHPAQFGCPPASELRKYEYDPAKAKQLLAEAGYADGFTEEFYVLETRPRIWIETVQAYLRDVGIIAELKPVNSTVLYEATAESIIPFMFTNSGSNSIRDVSALWGPFFGTRRDIVRDEELTGWVKAAGATVDEAVRIKLYKQVAAKIIDQLYWLPLWIEGTAYAFSSDLEYTPWDDENPRYYFAKWK